MKKLFLVLALALSLNFAVVPITASAATFKSDACKGLSQLGDNPCANDGGAAKNSLESTISKIVNILSYVVGVVAVIMIIIAGFKYMSAGGDSSAISSAKTTLVYALIGLAVAALAQFLVHFVLASVD